MNNKTIFGYDPIALGLNVLKMRPNGQFLVFCPYGNHNKAHGNYDPIKGIFYCFACKATADRYKLRRDLHGTIQRKQFELPEPIVDRNEWEKLLTNPLAVDHSYLKKRQVGNDLIVKYQIRHTHNSIVIPFYDMDHKVQGVLERKLVGNLRYVFYGEIPVIYPLQDYISEHDKIILVEGIFGFLRAKAAGYDNVFSILGSYVKKDLKKYLTPYGNKIYGVFDNDFAGHKASEKLLEMFTGSKVLSPGIEADEISIKQWQDIFTDCEFYSSLTTYQKVICE